MNSSLIYLILKVLVSAIIIVAISEVAKRSSLIGGIVGSIPLTSILAMIWLYSDTHDKQKIISLSYDIFWLVIPSLAFFISMPFLLKKGLNFYAALSLSVIFTAMCYGVMIFLLQME